MREYKLLFICFSISLLAFLGSCEKITSSNQDNQGTGDTQDTTDTQNTDVLKEQILFTSNRFASSNPGELGYFERLTIHRMNPDGSGVQQITELRSNNESHFEASASPDGSKIAFSLMIIPEDTTKNNELYVYTANIDGSNMQKIAGTGEEHLINPRWGPDSLIAFGSNKDGDYDIYTVESDGSNRTKITESDSSDAYPTWSPDGKRIAFTSDRHGQGDIYIIDLQTREVIRVTEDKGNNSFPRWSPNGSKITFTSTRDGDSEAYVINIQSGELLQLTNNNQPDASFTWSPDGEQIGYIATRSGNKEVFKINADGIGNPVNLSNSPATDWDPHWDSLKIETD